MKGTLLLIDANSLIHRAYHALPPFTSPEGKPTGALYGLASILIKIFREGMLNNDIPKFIVAAFDTPEITFREKEYKEYKITRPPAADDLISQLKEAQRLLQLFGIKTIKLPGWEADDLLATIASRFKASEAIKKVVILSGDLDMLQMVKDDKVVAIMPQKGISNTVVYDETSVFKRFGVAPKLLADYKGLVGDKSDNIPGVPGIGPKTAANVISKFQNLENLYREIDEVGLPDLKLQSKLQEYKDQAFLSKKLATLDQSAPVEVSLEELRLPAAVDGKQITVYFEELGFNSLIDRLAKL
ncbi:MAG: hypothetical protein COX15_01420 [Candidatus Colwellbacteria bacterium CG23_combo_of_CG06-09_8_20_14_all_42_19]|uniref:5'-3' exonuclease domain-containing protein n=1 Tax=Candidatus Colwellbacteria bacterium CG23_combo_of_CG06-09_8_20_14_all_42_19 TaxID=1974541 RepID=A0A2H0AL25_9BACT|nr:MAG: hypothetical protein COX15_01420 [Candidatus Colwellbacteria bacterium CG23_combo_of_CG06-09_8_20_14_all_42_19]